MTTPAHTYSVPAMSCDHCVTAITNHVQPLPGVERIAVDLDTKTVTVIGGVDQTIAAAIDQAGYDID